MGGSTGLNREAGEKIVSSRHSLPVKPNTGLAFSFREADFFFKLLKVGLRFGLQG